MKKVRFGLMAANIWCMVLVSVSLVGCNDDDDANIADYDIVKTQHSETFWNDNAPTTYYLLDEVRWIEDEGGLGNTNPTITRDFDQTILASIVENMAGLGYTRVNTLDTDNLPDIIIRANALATTYADIGLIYDNWYSWWGFYGPYYPGGLYPVYYEWTEGTILIEMGDGTSLNETEKTIDIVWIAGINGLVRGNQSGNLDFIASRIDDAFDQSSYLKP
ncbi:MAG: DUF4136 domain-containing protein [Flavobacteriaceae bacterium]